jgi:hypothetical protein
MKHISAKYFSLLVIALALCGRASADPITGAISFNGLVQLYNSSNGATSTVNDAVGVSSWLLPEVGDADGVLGLFATSGDTVTFHAPWAFNTTSEILNFWTVGGFTFTLRDSSVGTSGPGSLSVSGVGSIAGNGYDATEGTWNFTTQDPSVGRQASFSFSAASGAEPNVPEGGTTALLVGLSLLGLRMIRNRRNLV